VVSHDHSFILPSAEPQGKGKWSTSSVFQLVKKGRKVVSGLGNHKEIWVFPKIRGKTPKMDGENNGKPY